MSTMATSSIEEVSNGPGKNVQLYIHKDQLTDNLIVDVNVQVLMRCV